MSTLGPGVRVYIGWCPDHETAPIARAARCSIGTVIDGPYPKGTLFNSPSMNRFYRSDGPMWRVTPDGQPPVFVGEKILYPLDDGDPGELVDEREHEDRVDA